MRRALLIGLLWVPLVGAWCDDGRDCEQICLDRYESCTADGPSPACDVAYDDCLDGCLGAAPPAFRAHDGG